MKRATTIIVLINNFFMKGREDRRAREINNYNVHDSFEFEYIEFIIARRKVVYFFLYYTRIVMKVKRDAVVVVYIYI